MSRSSNREEAFTGGFASPSSSLLRLAGGWGNVGGPGLFMIRSITSGTITAIFAGMAGAIISALIYDTASIPFLVCSCAGFVVGSLGFYRDSLRKALLYLDRYPRLMQIHLDANFPHRRFDLWTRDSLRSSNFRPWTLQSMLIVSWLSAMPAIEIIIDQDEQKAIEEAPPVEEIEQKE